MNTFLRTNLIILTVFVSFLSYMHVNAQSAHNIDENMVRRLLVDSPDSILKMLDCASSDKTAHFPEFKADLYRALAYNQLRQNIMKKHYAEKTLKSDSIGHYPELRLKAMNVLIDALCFTGNYHDCIRISREAIKIARSIGDKPAEYGILGTMAKMYLEMGQKATGYELLDRIIADGQRSGRVQELAYVSWALGIKTIWFNDDSRFKEAIKTGRKRLEIIKEIETAGGSPDGYCDQQKAYTYARLAASLGRAGMKIEASEAYRKFNSTDFGKTPNGRLNIVDYLQDSGQYDKVLEATIPYHADLATGDSINNDYWSLLYSEAKAYKGLGRLREGYDLLYRASVIQDSLQSREKSGKAQEFAALFRLNERDNQLLLAKADLQRHQILSLSALGIGLMALALLAFVTYHYRNSMKRNRIAARQIDELLAQREELRRSSERNIAPKSKDGHVNIVLPEACDAIPDDEEYALFLTVEAVIVQQQLFLQPASEKKGIASQCGISQVQLSRLIKKYSDSSISDYLNKLKVEYSVKLMKQHPEWTVEAIAHTAGYASRNTFYQNFNKVYGMTPMQYRKGTAG